MALQVIEENLILEMNLGEFKAWGGGESRLNAIRELDVANEAEDYIVEIHGSELIDATTLNDILWFEMDDFIAQYDKGWA